jgi:hypothetical protein
MEFFRSTSMVPKHHPCDAPRPEQLPVFWAYGAGFLMCWLPSLRPKNCFATRRVKDATST